MQKKIKISICIVAHNEEEVIETCLKNVYGWADEIIVVDGQSTDRTAQISRKYAKVFIKPNDPSHHKNKQWCMSKAKNEWVFSLDADELLSDELKKSIAEIVRQNNKEYNGYFMGRRQMINGKFLKYDWIGFQLRLYRKGKHHFKGLYLHEYITIDGNTSSLKGDLIHFGWWRGMGFYIHKINNYTTYDAISMVKRGEHFSLFKLIKGLLTQIVYMFRWRIIFNTFPYGLFLLFCDLFHLTLLYFKVKEYERVSKNIKNLSNQFYFR